MNLTLFFRLIVMSIFQRDVVLMHNNVLGSKMNYFGTLFYSPRIYAKDGFSVSTQIHYGSYCTSENGYRKLGHTFITVEAGFPRDGDKELNDVAQVEVKWLEDRMAEHGGVDWEKTISIEQFNSLVYNQYPQDPKEIENKKLIE